MAGQIKAVNGLRGSVPVILLYRKVSLSYTIKPLIQVPAPYFSRILEKGAWAANAAKPPLFIFHPKG